MKLTKEYIRGLMMDTLRSAVLVGKEDYIEEIEEDILTLPITISSRFSRTLGQLWMRRTPVSYEPIEFRFGKHIEEYSKEVIDEIIKHELMHLIATVVHCDNCKHDARWKAICRVYGVKPSATTKVY